MASSIRNLAEQIYKENIKIAVILTEETRWSHDKQRDNSHFHLSSNLARDNKIIPILNDSTRILPMRPLNEKAVYNDNTLSEIDFNLNGKLGFIPYDGITCTMASVIKFIPYAYISLLIVSDLYF